MQPATRAENTKVMRDSGFAVKYYLNWSFKGGTINIQRSKVRQVWCFQCLEGVCGCLSGCSPNCPLFKTFTSHSFIRWSKSPPSLWEYDTFIQTSPTHGNHCSTCKLQLIENKVPFCSKLQHTDCSQLTGTGGYMHMQILSPVWQGVILFTEWKAWNSNGVAAQWAAPYMKQWLMTLCLHIVFQLVQGKYRPTFHLDKRKTKLPGFYIQKMNLWKDKILGMSWAKFNRFL